MSETLSVKEAANLLKIKPFSVRQMCLKGKLKAKKIPGTKKWLISHDELKKFLP